MKLIEEIPFAPGSRERKRALGRRHYQQHKERKVETTRKWREENRERHAEASRKYHATVAGRARHLFNAAKGRSQRKGLEFSISFEWVVEKLTFARCEVSGIPFIFLTGGDGVKHPYAPSLDRIDNTKGYTPGNCRIILWALNLAFATWGEETYRDIASHVVREFDL